MKNLGLFLLIAVLAFSPFVALVAAATIPAPLVALGFLAIVCGCAKGVSKL